MNKMLLNCDLGEHYGSWTMGPDELVMPFIDQANIACGFHAGDPLTISKTLALAKQHSVTVGAHPAYPDLVGFGRRSMNMTAAELTASLLYQISALDGMAACNGQRLHYVKPHGALYNDMMRDTAIRATIMRTIGNYHQPLALMLQATPHADEHKSEADEHGIDVLFEAFADRCYDNDGALLARSKMGAVHNREKMLAQVAQIRDSGSITTLDGKCLQLRVDTLCVHGDNAEGVAAIETIRALVDGE